MSVNDPISDLLTQLRNATRVGKAQIEVPHSRIKADIVRVLKREGYIEDFKLQREGAKTRIEIALRGKRESGAFSGLKRISTPGRRKYVNVTDIPRILGGMGICVLSTSSGVMTGQEAKKKNVGGEVLCHVW